jgi:hypothetical protein
MPVKERPILFKPDMVKAILAGRKTQTRRLFRWQPLDVLPMSVPDQWVTLDTRGPNHGSVIGCRFGAHGDRLWVRETWRIIRGKAETSVQFKAGGFKECVTVEERAPGLYYSANVWPIQENSVDVWPWRPSIFMRRWMSRVLLEITAVRPERLQAITDDDICREIGAPLHWEGQGPEPYQRDLRGCFALLWDGINGKRATWASNPWVWVIEFKKWSPT